MNHDLALVAAVLETREYSDAVKAGAGPELLGEEAQMYWELITGHYERFHEVPSLDMFQEWAQSYVHNVSGDSVSSIVHNSKP